MRRSPAATPRRVASRPAAGPVGGPTSRLGADRGQSTVELALVLPVIGLLLLLVAGVGRVAHDAIGLAHAAREAARVAAVDPDPARIHGAALRGGGLDPDRLLIRVGPRGVPGSIVEVFLEYRVPLAVPLRGDRGPDLVLTADAASRVEG